MPDTTNLWSENRDLGSENILNTNDIRVNITDSAPIVILFGPPSCGKTMTLVRLTRWLKENGHYMKAALKAIEESEKGYQCCDDYFEHLIHSDTVVTATCYNMLVKVSEMERVKKEGRMVQILDLPGEHYVNEVNPKAPSFPPYIYEIINSRNRKIWMFYTEPDDMKDVLYRRNYVQVLALLRRYFITPYDRTIFICSKADKRPEYFREDGQPIVNLFFRTIKEQYPDIFTPWENPIPLRWWRPYDFDFFVFSAGKFFDNKNHHYVMGPDSYPANLWKTIMKMAKNAKSNQ